MTGFRGWAAAGLVLALAGCGEPLPEDPVIVEIGERTITHSHFEGYVANMVDEQAPFAEGELKAELLNQFIDEQLLLMDADAKGIEVEHRHGHRRVSTRTGSRSERTGSGRCRSAG